MSATSKIILGVAVMLLLPACATTPGATAKVTILESHINFDGQFRADPRSQRRLYAQEQGTLRGPSYDRATCQKRPPRHAPPPGTVWYKDATYDNYGHRACRYIPVPKDRGWHSRGSRHY